jgi:Resolvase, N terminal domain
MGLSLSAPWEGDAIVVVGIDRLGRNAAEVMTTTRELGERDIVLRSLREGIDTSNATGLMGGRACWPVSLSLTWSWVVSAALRPVRHVGRVVSPLGVPRHLTTRNSVGPAHTR